MPTGFNIGPLFVHFYGIILMLGALAGAWLADREAKRRGLNSDLVWDALIWILIGGIVGARLWHILTPPPSMVAQGITTEWYLRHPLDMLNTRMGGLGIPGAIIGGMIALYFFTRRRKTSFAVWADIAAPALALGQAIGRWGNYINQEVYGAPTNLPWAITIDPQHRLPEYKNIATYHPLFLYESLWNAANLILLLWLGRKYQHRLKPGDLIITYLLVYPLGRFLLEFLRLDSAQIAGINANQTVSLIVALAAGVALFLRHRPGHQAPESVPQPSKRPSKRAR
jgi:phosphatidylglycerol---prolipoprotein diacylglyceryl transferase